MIEQTISHYRLLSKLGAGGMGEVYLARDIHLDREVAIKFPSSSSLDEHDRARFMREARLASTFQHPNIATVFDFGETPDSRPFLVIELVRGRSLHELIKKKELSLSRSIAICLDVAKALTEAHSHGILHRDIKPSNIVINNRGAVKVLDFGLAKQLKLTDIDLSAAPTFSEDDSLTARGVILGTPAYMSPEQVRDDELDGRSDLYSLGVTLYECATGVTPFKGSNIQDVCAQVLHTDARKPSELNPAITSEIDEVILKAMRKERDSRYAAVTDFAEALEAAAGSISSADTRKFEDADSVPVASATRSLFATTPVEKVPAAISARPRAELISKPYLMGIAIAMVAAAVVVAMALWPRSSPPSAESRNLFDRGVEALRNGSYVTASSLLTEAVQTHDNWPVAHARLAEAWVDLDNIEMATRAITAAHARAQQGPKLSAEDDLYLKAITSTVDLKFKDAVTSFEEIERLHANSADITFDSGRSLERATQTDGAIAKFEKVLSMNARSPATHLRLGILYGRKGNLAKGNEHFDRAREIYQSQQSSEGVTEASLQRGAMYVRAEKFQLARPDLEAALKQARSEVPNAFQEIRALIQLSVADSQDAQLERAQQLALEAFDIADRSGLEYLTTPLRIVLGDVLYRKNQVEKGEANTVKALQLSERYRVPRWINVSRFNLGSIRIYQNRNTEGLALIRQAKEYYDQTGNAKRSLDSLTMIAQAQRNLGNYLEAKKTLDDQLALIDKKDTVSRAHACYDMAVLQFILEDWVGARSSYEQALVFYEQEDMKPAQCRSLAGIAACESFLGRTREARRHLSEAVKLATDASMKFDLLLSEARVAVPTRSFDIVVRKASETLQGTDPTDQTTRVSAKILLATGLLGLGRDRESEKEAREAIEIASGFEGMRLLSLAKLALAEALLAPSRSRTEAVESRSSALEASAEFSRAGQSESQWRSLLAAALACARIGDVTSSQEYARHSGSLFEKVAAGPGHESYRARQDIVYRNNQLAFLQGGRRLEPKAR